MGGYREGKFFDEIYRPGTTLGQHGVQQVVNSLLDIRPQLLDVVRHEEGLDHSSAADVSKARGLSGKFSCLCLMCAGASMSTKVGLFLAAALPPALSSGKPGRLRS